jgi:hypothetical protein
MYPTHNEFAEFGDKKRISTEKSTSAASQNSFRLQPASNPTAPPFSNGNQFNYQLFEGSFHSENRSQQSVVGNETSPSFLFEPFHNNVNKGTGNVSSMLDDDYSTTLGNPPSFPLLKPNSSSNNSRQQHSKSLANSIKSDMNDFLYPSNQNSQEQSQQSIVEVPKTSSFATSTVKVYIVSCTIFNHFLTILSCCHVIR